MREWIMRIFGITELIREQQKTNRTLEKIHYEVKRSADFAEAYNKTYHIR